MIVLKQEALTIFKALLSTDQIVRLQHSDFDNTYFSLTQHFPTLIHKKSNVGLELHDKLCYPFQTQLSINHFIPEIMTDSIMIHDHVYDYNIPSIEDALLLACYHMYLHQACEQVFRIKFVSDILYLISNYQIDYDLFRYKTFRYGSREPVGYAFSVCNELSKYVFNENVIDERYVYSIAWDQQEVTNVNQIRSRYAINSGILGYHQVPLEDRYFISRWDHDEVVAKMVEEHMGIGIKTLARKRTDRASEMLTISITDIDPKE